MDPSSTCATDRTHVADAVPTSIRPEQRPDRQESTLLRSLARVQLILFTPRRANRTGGSTAESHVDRLPSRAAGKGPAATPRLDRFFFLVVSRSRSRHNAPPGPQVAAHRRSA
jgi:hypothetical protein